MQNRYTADVGDYLKFGILRALSPGYRLGVAWWLYPDETHNTDGRHVDFLSRPAQWRHYDPGLFDALGGIVSASQRHVRALETADLLPGAIFHSDVIRTNEAITQRRQVRQEWFETVLATLHEADLVFADPNNGLEPDGYSHGSAKAGKSITVAELRAFARPGRCLIVYHHQTRRTGGHHAEINYWAGRLRQAGFTTVDALRAKPYSPRVFFLLDALDDVRRRAAEIERTWLGLISWHPDVGGVGSGLGLDRVAQSGAVERPQEALATGGVSQTPVSSAAHQRRRTRAGATTQIGYVNRNQQEVIRATGKPGTDHGQYVYVLSCRTCGHEYGANGSDIWLRCCPAHDGGAGGLPV